MAGASLTKMDWSLAVTGYQSHSEHSDECQHSYRWNQRIQPCWEKMRMWQKENVANGSRPAPFGRYPSFFA
jgi:hypothetical protein